MNPISRRRTSTETGFSRRNNALCTEEQWTSSVIDQESTWFEVILSVRGRVDKQMFQDISFSDEPAVSGLYLHEGEIERVFLDSK